MIKVTQSMRTWLWNNHNDIYALVVMFGHIELVTDDMYAEYIEWCKDCQHNEVCRYYPYDGCQFKDASERPKGEWVFNPPDAIDLMFAKPKCSKCGFESSDGGNFYSNCGADMRGEDNVK